jgi:tripeptidyl-peptidase-1
VPLLRLRYGAHLSKEQVAQLVAPHSDTLELVSSWLTYNGVLPSSISTTHGGGWLTVTGVPVFQANNLLGASYRLYYHAGTNETIIRTLSYALPAALHIHVQTVAPTTAFASMRLLQQTSRSRSGGAAANATSGEIVNLLLRQFQKVARPSDVRSLYKTEAYVPATTGQNVLGIAGFGNEYPSQLDLLDFMESFRSDAEDPTFSSWLVNGGVDDPRHPGRRANLETQYTVAIAYPTPINYYTIGGTLQIPPNGEALPGDAFLVWLDYMLDQSSVPQTISLSYGVDEPTIPVEYAASLCLLFGRLGARGASVLVASGNRGVGAGECLDRSGNVRFYTTFPASCTCGI